MYFKIVKSGLFNNVIVLKNRTNSQIQRTKSKGSPSTASTASGILIMTPITPYLPVWLISVISRSISRSFHLFDRPARVYILVFRHLLFQPLHLSAHSANQMVSFFIINLCVYVSPFLNYFSFFSFADGILFCLFIICLCVLHMIHDFRLGMVFD